MLPVLLALALLAHPDPAADEDEEEVVEEGGPSGLVLAAVAGVAVEAFQANGRTFPFGGVQVGWAFGDMEVGALAQAYHFGDAAVTPWSPVLLLRIDQRFRTARGVSADLGLGVGAGRVDTWKAWFQATLGVRLEQGPLLLGAEVGFEQNQLLRLGASIGFRL